MGKYTEHAGREASVFNEFEKRLSHWGVSTDGFFDRMLKGGLFASEICQLISDRCMRIVYGFDDIIVLEPEVVMTYNEANRWMNTHKHLYIPAELTTELMTKFYQEVVQDQCFVASFEHYPMYLVYKSKGSFDLNVPGDYKFSKNTVILAKRPVGYRER